MSKILSYLFALIVIFATGNVIVSIVVLQDTISVADAILVFCLLMIMLMGFYYIGNDIRQIPKKEKVINYDDDGVLDEELVK